MFLIFIIKPKNAHYIFQDADKITIYVIQLEIEAETTAKRKPRSGHDKRRSRNSTFYFSSLPWLGL